MPITTRIGSLSSRGFGQFASAVPSTPRIVFIGTYANATDASSYIFPSVNIGSAAIDRLVVLTCGAQIVSGVQMSMSAIIDGRVATKVVGVQRGVPNAIFSQSVGIGTTTSMTISATTTDPSLIPSFANVTIGVWAIYGLQSSIAISTADAQNPASGLATATIVTAASGFLVMCANNSTGISGSITLTGVTRRYNVYTERTRAGGDASTATSQNLAISAKYSTSPTGTVTLAAATFK